MSMFSYALGPASAAAVIRSASPPIRSRSGPESFRSSATMASATDAGESAVGDIRAYAVAAAARISWVGAARADGTRPLEGSCAEVRLDEAGLHREDADAEVRDLEM